MSGERQQASDYKLRRELRYPIDEVSRLRNQGAYSVEVRIRDVSTSGFMAECVEPVRIGSLVKLDVPGLGGIEAQVRWQIGARMGGMFIDPISLGACEWTATRSGPALD